MKKISDIFPQKLLADPSQAGIMAALDDQFDTFGGLLDDIIGIMDVTNQTDVRILDTLAYCFGLQLYDQGTDLATKKAILAKAVELRRKIGTIYSIREAVKMVADPAKFDWDNYPLEFTERPGATFDGTYDYDGTIEYDSIFHWARFSVVVKYLTALSAAEEALIEKAILAYKPLRCQLVDLTYEQAVQLVYLYFASGAGAYTQNQSAFFGITGDLSYAYKFRPITGTVNSSYFLFMYCPTGGVNVGSLRYQSGNLYWVQGTTAAGYDIVSVGPITLDVDNIVIVQRTGSTGVNNVTITINGTDYTISTTKAPTSCSPYLCLWDSTLIALNNAYGYSMPLWIGNRLLTAGEKTAAIAGTFPDASTSVGSWAFSEETGTTIYDAGPNGIDLTAVNATWALCP